MPFLALLIGMLTFGAQGPEASHTRRLIALHADDAAPRLHDDAMEAFRNGRIQDALRGFNRVLELDPFNASVYYHRGIVRYIRREFELAADDFTTALKIRPNFPNAAMKRGMSHSSLGRLEEALEDFNQAVTLDPSNPEAFYRRAIAHVERGYLTAAFADYAKIVRLEVSDPNPSGAKVRLNALLSRVDEGRFGEHERRREIITELGHGRTIEQLLDFADRTCIQNGDDKERLTEFADLQGWTRIPQDELDDVGTDTIRLLSGWRLQKRIGAVSVIQAETRSQDATKSCWITVNLGQGHWFEDLMAVFSNRFQSPDLVIQNGDGRRIGQQVVSGRQRAPVQLTLSENVGGEVITVRAVHGEKVRRDLERGR